MAKSRGKSKPCMGYPSITDAVLALTAEGKCRQVVADLVGIRYRDVGSIINRQTYRAAYLANKAKAVPRRDTYQESDAPLPASAGIWGLPENERRIAIAKRASAAAREALKAPALGGPHV